MEEHLSSFKVFPRYYGPYIVVRRNLGGAYILSELNGAIHSQPYAAFRLISYIQRNSSILRDENSNSVETQD